MEMYVLLVIFSIVIGVIIGFIISTISNRKDAILLNKKMEDYSELELTLRDFKNEYNNEKTRMMELETDIAVKNERISNLEKFIDDGKSGNNSLNEKPESSNDLMTALKLELNTQFNEQKASLIDEFKKISDGILQERETLKEALKNRDRNDQGFSFKSANRER